jgi:rRNA-processing protein EBP2
MKIRFWLPFKLETDDGQGFDISHIDETSSSEESEDEDEEDIEDLNGSAEAGANVEEDEGEGLEVEEPDGVPLPQGFRPNGPLIEGEVEDIPFSDIASLSSEERGDVVPYQRLTINNHAALTASLSRIALPTSNTPFSTLQSVTSTADTVIQDVNDDLNRELAFYAQSLAAVKEAKKQLKAEGIPFSRPSDYFAEMVKSEEHMERVKQRLVDDAASKKAASDARRQRDLKKFGKAVQIAKQQERDKAKRETLDKINVLKRSELFAQIQPVSAGV